MADDAPEPFSLKRWSQRKRAATQEKSLVPSADSAVPPATVSAADATVPAPSPAAGPVTEPLPPVESLTFDSDYRAFLQPEVDEGVKRAAFKKLFSDPRFNVMDGLDTYIGDYTLADPMPEGMLDKLAKVYAVVTEPEAKVDEVPTRAVPPADPPVAKLADVAQSSAAPVVPMPASPAASDDTAPDGKS